MTSPVRTWRLGARDPGAIDADIAGIGQGRRRRPGCAPAGRARATGRCADGLWQALQRRSLASASSCAFKAASLAKGEFGSATFSRSRGRSGSRRTRRPLPIAFARRPVEPLLGFVPALVAVMTFGVRLLGGGALGAWAAKPSVGAAATAGNSRIRLAWRALLRGLVPARFAALEARTARAFGTGRPARPPRTPIMTGSSAGFSGAASAFASAAALDGVCRRFSFFGYRGRTRSDRIRGRLQRRFQGLLDSCVADFGSALLRRCFAFDR